MFHEAIQVGYDSFNNHGMAEKTNSARGDEFGYQHPLRHNIYRKNEEVKTNTNKVERKGKLWLVGSFDFWVLCPNRAAARLTAKALNQPEELGPDRGREIRKSDPWKVEIQSSKRFGWKVRTKTWNVHSCGRQICCCATIQDAWTVQEAFALLSSVNDYEKLLG